ncbi:unnamed protein product [Cyprideis torosa]|uniref:Uncharacterized protein n=1 Tax=Cyprideis torosa TaxID=163714 RepID=A0A7R8ZGJ9_9CRUS|nr:unnamed protein product [Cyprideis torosa]CAG0880219.1 unnamed protein product [Cyprideis torosa]
MAFQLVLMAALAAIAVADRSPYAPHPTYQPAYGPTYQPAYQPSYHQPAYHEPAYAEPAYAPRPSYGHYPEVPACAANGTLNYCLEDKEYPEYEVKHAIKTHKYGFLELYADVADLNTDNSVDRLTKLVEETYICPSETIYARPLRAKNTDGKWRVIVNNVKVDYDEFTQSVRLETCLTPGSKCPLIPDCYETSCLQKWIYHRFVVYDSYDQYFPFAIESFRLPASCACKAEAFAPDH